MRAPARVFLLLGLAAAQLAASPPAAPTPSPAPSPSPSPAPSPRNAEPERVVVQHILVSFGDAIPGKKVPRTQDEARVLAGQLLERARKGEDFDALVKQYTDDQHPGIYAMFNKGVTQRARDEYPRQGMVPCFGDLSFSLAPGEIGVCELDPARSPYGWHIIKRLK
jgi:parvulin-like peptidyl-prolyl isomerase